LISVGDRATLRRVRNLRRLNLYADRSTLKIERRRRNLIRRRVVVVPRLDNAGGDTRRRRDHAEATVLAVHRVSLLAEDVDGGVEHVVVLVGRNTDRIADIGHRLSAPADHRGEHGHKQQVLQERSIHGRSV